MVQTDRDEGKRYRRGYATHGVPYLRDLRVIGEADAQRPITLTVIDPEWSDCRSHGGAKGSDVLAMQSERGDMRLPETAARPLLRSQICRR